MPFGQGYGVGMDEDSPELVPPVPQYWLGAPTRQGSLTASEPFPRQIPSPKNCTKRGEIELSPRPFVDMLSQGNSSQVFETSFVDLPGATPPAPLRTATAAAALAPVLAQAAVYPQSASLWAALGLPSDGEQPVHRSHARLKKSSSSSRATVEKVEEWLGAMTPAPTAVPMLFVEGEGEGEGAGEAIPAKFSVVEGDLGPEWGMVEQVTVSRGVLPGGRWRRSPTSVAETGTLDVPRSPGHGGEVVWAGEAMSGEGGHVESESTSNVSLMTIDARPSGRSFGAAPHKRKTINSLTTLAPFRLAPAPVPKRRGTRGTPGTDDSQQTLSYTEPGPESVISGITGQPPPLWNGSAPTRPPYLAPPGLIVSTTSPRRRPPLDPNPQPRRTGHEPDRLHPATSRVVSSSSFGTRPSTLSSFTASSSADEGLFFRLPGLPAAAAVAGLEGGEADGGRERRERLLSAVEGIV